MSAADDTDAPQEAANAPQRSARMAKLFSVSEVRPHLFIAGYGALSERKFRELGITHAVDATNLPKPLRIKNTQYLDVHVDDSEYYEINKHFDAVAAFVTQAKQDGGKAIVYCAAGISRAATLTMMYLVIAEGMRLEDAYYDVLRVRPLIAPNLGFWRQMIDFEARCNGGKATVELLKGMSRPVPSAYLRKSKVTNER